MRLIDRLYLRVLARDKGRLPKLFVIIDFPEHGVKAGGMDFPSVDAAQACGKKEGYNGFIRVHFVKAGDVA